MTQNTEDDGNAGKKEGSEKEQKGLYDQPGSGVKLPLKGGYPDISKVAVDDENRSFPRHEEEISHMPERDSQREYRYVYFQQKTMIGSDTYLNISSAKNLQGKASREIFHKGKRH